MNTNHRDLTRLAEVRRMYRNGEARALRIASAVSQAELARAIGASRSALSLWESGRRSPHGDAALRCWIVLEAMRAMAA